MRVDMVFEGGGAKGMAFVGAAEELERRHITPARLVGTSAGAITAALTAVGYTAAEMRSALAETENGKPVFAGFMDGPRGNDFPTDVVAKSLMRKVLGKLDLKIDGLGTFGGLVDSFEDKVRDAVMRGLLENPAYCRLFSLVEEGGLYAGNAFRKWLTAKLDVKGAGVGGMTLGQLQQAKGSDLSLVVTDTTARELRVLNHRTTPDCPVVWAVRMSMSIPFAWREVTWRHEWGGYQLRSDDGRTVRDTIDLDGHAVVDGGVLSNFPIALLSSPDPEVRHVMGDADPNAAPTLGMLIDEELEVPNAPPAPNTAADDDAGLKGDVRRLRTIQRISRLLNTMMSARDRQAIATYGGSSAICRPRPTARWSST